MEDIVSKLRASKKYANVCQDTIERVASEALRKYKKPRDAEKAAREVLHGITGAFMTDTDIKRANDYIAKGDMLSALSLHSSTRERMPLDAFYDKLFSVTGKPETVLDLACGLNPIYLGQIGVRVLGIDINGQQIKLINDCGLAGVTAETRDLLCENALPENRYDMTLCLKLLPVLESQKKGSATALIGSLKSLFSVISFPTRTLGGRNVGMEKHYSEWFEQNVPNKYGIINRYTMNNELVYVLREV